MSDNKSTQEELNPNIDYKIDPVKGTITFLKKPNLVDWRKKRFNSKKALINYRNKYKRMTRVSVSYSGPRVGQIFTVVKYNYSIFKVYASK